MSHVYHYIVQLMLHCRLLLTSCLRILTKSPQQLYKTTLRSLSVIAELLVLRQYLHKNITSEQRKTTRSDFESDLDKLEANTTPSPLLTVPVHPSTVTVPINVLHTHKRKYMHIAQPKRQYISNIIIIIIPLFYTSQSRHTNPYLCIMHMRNIHHNFFHICLCFCVHCPYIMFTAMCPCVYLPHSYILYIPFVHFYDCLSIHMSLCMSIFMQIYYMYSCLSVCLLHSCAILSIRVCVSSCPFV